MSSCAACKCLRRKCTQECVFAPGFPPDNPQKFTNVHKVFGACNVSKLLKELDASQREDAVNSLAYEAEYRLRDPVYGCVGLISILQHKLKQVKRNLESAKKELSTYIGQSGIPHGAQLMIQETQQQQQQQQQFLEAKQTAAAAAEQEMMRTYEQQQQQQDDKYKRQLHRIKARGGLGSWFEFTEAVEITKWKFHLIKLILTFLVLCIFLNFLTHHQSGALCRWTWGCSDLRYVSDLDIDWEELSLGSWMNQKKP